MLSRIKSARIKAGLRAKLVAQSYGVSASLISLWESGKRPLNREREQEILAVIAALSKYSKAIRTNIATRLPSSASVAKQAVERLRQGQTI